MERLREKHPSVRRGRCFGLFGILEIQDAVREPAVAVRSRARWAARAAWVGPPSAAAPRGRDVRRSRQEDGSEPARTAAPIA
jgi:hypothetical protein